MSDSFKILESIKITSKNWSFADLRIDIPPMSFGSDASNPHTQYSNAIAMMSEAEFEGIGACFTLGEGNQFICAAADYIVGKLNGTYLKDLLDSSEGIADLIGNPLQLRWLSPNAGVPLMAAGLVLNTLIDFASKKAAMPAWKYLATLENDEFLKLVSLRQISNSRKVLGHFLNHAPSRNQLVERTLELEQEGIPAYFTTWIGSDGPSLLKEITEINRKNGITKFKVKIGMSLEKEIEKVEFLMNNTTEALKFSVDANQKLDLESAMRWMDFISNRGILWLEEPFAPDNILLFKELSLARLKSKWNGEIATGENCPNLHIAQALLEAGVNRFQADPCRMLGISDAAFSGILTKYYNAEYTPHAGGTGLDELSPHLQFLFLAKIDHTKRIDSSLTETIGFCSKFYQSPTILKNGRIKAPDSPGLLVGLETTVRERLIPFEEGVTWLRL